MVEKHPADQYFKDLPRRAAIPVLNSADEIALKRAQQIAQNTAPGSTTDKESQALDRGIRSIER